MPVTKSAIKKLRQDKRKTAMNKKNTRDVESVIKSIKKTKKGSINEAYSKIDRAKKKGLIHANKAARLKSQLSKIAPKKVGTGKTVKKAPTKKKAVSKAKKTSK